MAAERAVLGQREDSMIGFRWSGKEPQGLNDIGVAEEMGAVWEGDEPVHYNMGSLQRQAEIYQEDDYMQDND